MLPLIIIVTIVIAVIVSVIAILIVKLLTQKKYDNFILQNSISLDHLNEINSRYSFYPYINFNQHHTYDNERFYNNISCKDYLIYQLQFIRKSLFNQIEKVEINRQQYESYILELKSILQLGRFYSPVGNLKFDKLIKKEKYIIQKNTYSEPITQFFLTVTLYCSKINGQIYNRKSERFCIEEIFAFNKRLNNKNGRFYNDREIWEAICRVERGKVSNKMRFSIYERDGFKCANCGASYKYAKLEIDHIIPIAKGGKTTYDNLQTLCHKCNVEKSDNINR